MNKQDGGESWLDTVGSPLSVSNASRAPPPKAHGPSSSSDWRRIAAQPGAGSARNTFFLGGEIGGVFMSSVFLSHGLLVSSPFSPPRLVSFYLCVCVMCVCVCRLALGCWEHWAEFGFFLFHFFFLLYKHTHTHAHGEGHNTNANATAIMLPNASHEMGNVYELMMIIHRKSKLCAVRFYEACVVTFQCGDDVWHAACA